jgi:hypothetical protein
MSKFDSELAEVLYSETPDDELGNVSDFGWYGLYYSELGIGGYILTESNYGFVDMMKFETAEALDQAWRELMASATDYYDCVADELTDTFGAI